MTVHCKNCGSLDLNTGLRCNRCGQDNTRTTSPTAAGDVTGEMIDAGIAAMDDHGRLLHSKTVEAIYLAMRAVSPGQFHD